MIAFAVALAVTLCVAATALADESEEAPECLTPIGAP